MRIDIIGAGPAGLYAALLLQRQHRAHQVVVHERRARSDCTGLGIIMHPDTLQDMATRDPELAAQMRAHLHPVDKLSVCHQGQRMAGPATGLHSMGRTELMALLVQRCLHHGVQIEWGHAVDDLHALGSQTDLVIVANGAHSSLRDAHAHALGVTREVYGHRYFWLYTPHAFDGFVFDFAKSQDGVAVLHAYPYGAQCSSVIVEMPARQAQALSVACQGLRPAAARALGALFPHTLAGHELRLPSPDLPLVMEQFWTIACAQWVLPTQACPAPTVLMGDAARTVHFSVGSGTRLALADAGVLSDVLADAPPTDWRAALAHYQALRTKSLSGLTRKAQRSMAWFSQVQEQLHLSPADFTQSLLRRCH